MNYQNLLCVGDSLTLGARTYGCYPLILGQVLNRETPYTWRIITEGQNGNTCKDLWFLVNRILESVIDTYIACILIGTNDVGNSSPPELFREYYHQIINAFLIKGFKHIFCSSIPPIFPDGHAFFDKSCIERRNALNYIIAELVEQTQKTDLVLMNDLERSDYEDSVHLAESGNEKVANAFVHAIKKR